MPSVEPTRLTDDLWLAAHDSVKGKPQVGAWPLGVGLAAGLLAELIHGEHLELHQGELFRTTAEPPSDPALRPLLIKMQAEERSRVSTPQRPADRVRAQTSVDARNRQGWVSWPHDAPNGSRQANDGSGWPLQQRDGRDGATPHDRDSFRTPWVRERTGHRRCGHLLTTWLSYLAYEGRAEARVIDRLSRTGLVRRQERRRMWGGTTVSYVPYDSVVSGNPANVISTAVRSRRRLSRSELFLAGLLLAIGLHHHALATLSPFERSELADELKRGLDGMSRELLRAADAAVGDAAMR